MAWGWALARHRMMDDGHKLDLEGEPLRTWQLVFVLLCRIEVV